MVFLVLPKENVRPALLRKPELDLGMGGTGMSAYGFLAVAVFISS